MENQPPPIKMIDQENQGKEKQEKENIVGKPDLSRGPAQQPVKNTPASNQARQIDQEALSATITYLEGMPTEVDIESTVENIQAWQQRLHDAGKPELNGIADHLGSLIKYLTTPDPDSNAIGRSMIQIGEMTMKAANDAEADIGSQMKILGNWLKKVGESL